MKITEKQAKAVMRRAGKSAQALPELGQDTIIDPSASRRIVLAHGPDGYQLRCYGYGGVSDYLTK